MKRGIDVIFAFLHENECNVRLCHGREISLLNINNIFSVGVFEMRTSACVAWQPCTAA